MKNPKTRSPQPGRSEYSGDHRVNSSRPPRSGIDQLVGPFAHDISRRIIVAYKNIEPVILGEPATNFGCVPPASASIFVTRMDIDWKSRHRDYGQIIEPNIQDISAPRQTMSRLFYKSREAGHNDLKIFGPM
jgi:hypothetical protein